MSTFSGLQLVSFINFVISVSCILSHANKGLTYKEISLLLKEQRDILLSPNAIRKRLKRAGFPCRRGPTGHSRNDVKSAILEILPTSPHTLGYRQMTDILRQRKMHVRRKTVMTIMREVDPFGVEYRRRRRIKRKVYRSFGPNHIWHVDGYDKLKPYGFPIHGCIDGFSRKIMWLNVGPSNNDPALVATNYVHCVHKLRGCPLILQSDPGTENGIMGALQCVFRHNASDMFGGIQSYRVVRSVFNQRIEAWWSMMRRQQMDWWITFFKDLESFGGFHKGNEDELHCLRYCFMPVLQSDLDLLRDRWNNHYISCSRDSVCPNGRPCFLHIYSENKGFENCLFVVSDEDIEFAYNQCRPQTRSGSSEFDTQARNIFSTRMWHDAKSWREALYQYFCLVDSNVIV